MHYNKCGYINLRCIKIFTEKKNYKKIVIFRDNKKFD